MVPPAPDPARRNERSRRAILAAAIALIGELGYDQVSIEAIDIGCPTGLGDGGRSLRTRRHDDGIAVGE